MDFFLIEKKKISGDEVVDGSICFIGWGWREEIRAIGFWEEERVGDRS